MKRLKSAFFERDPVVCARELIGCHFEWHGCVGKIVETEAYAAEGDEACHTWFRPSAREFVGSHRAGDAYVYLNYGVHWMFNFLVKGGELEGFVLLRAVEPVRGLELMQERRPKSKEHQLCAGPGRLTRAMGIDDSSHGLDVLNSKGIGLYHGECDGVVSGPRIGITKAVELPWRYGDSGSASLSRPF